MSLAGDLRSPDIVPPSTRAYTGQATGQHHRKRAERLVHAHDPFRQAGLPGTDDQLRDEPCQQQELDSDRAEADPRPQGPGHR